MQWLGHMDTRFYIASDNVKAYRVLSSLGYTLTPGVHSHYDYDYDDNYDVLFSRLVFFVDWKGSRRAFHKFLKVHGLLKYSRGFWTV